MYKKHSLKPKAMLLGTLLLCLNTLLPAQNRYVPPKGWNDISVVRNDEIRLYPNPVKDELKLNVQIPVQGSTCRMYDPLGKALQTQALRSAMYVEVVGPKTSFNTITVTGTPIDFFNGKTINIPVFNLKASYIIGTPSQDGTPSQEYIQIGYNGTIKPRDPLQSSSFRSAKFTDLLKKTGAVPESGVKIETIGDPATTKYAVKIVPDAALPSAAMRSSEAPTSADGQNVLRASTFPGDIKIVYTSPKDQWVNLSMDNYDPVSFSWDGLLTYYNGSFGSLSRQNFYAYFVNSETPGKSDSALSITSGSFMMFAPSLIYYDTDVPGKETFTTINTFPVTDVMVVYIKDGTQDSQTWKALDTAGFTVKEIVGNLSDFVHDTYLKDRLGTAAGKIITYVPPNTNNDPDWQNAKILTDDNWADWRKDYFVNDPAFGAVDSYQNTGAVTTLSMSTANLEPGYYTRYILWRRGYKAADNTIKGVGYVFDSYAADAFAIATPVTIKEKVVTDIKDAVLSKENLVYPNPSRDGIFKLATGSNEIHWTVFDMNGKQILQGNAPLVDLSFCPKGIYLIKVQTGKDIVTAKLIKL